MKEESKSWLNKAEDDLRKAKDNFGIGNYDLTAFLCQQSSEKALKSYLIEKKGIFPKIHDLVILGRKVEIPENLIDKIKELTLAYIYTRYPDIKEEPNLKNKSEDFLKNSKEVLEWVKENI